ncbi:hypothetical protein Lal_00010237 [Lupinus albus]|nr:hypothetical protein Lal_00010237 [Lupinus albus]
MQGLPINCASALSKAVVTFPIEGLSFPLILTLLQATFATLFKASISGGGISPDLIKGTAHSTMFPSSYCMSMAFLPLRISNSRTPKLYTSDFVDQGNQEYQLVVLQVESYYLQDQAMISQNQQLLHCVLHQ